MQPVNDDMDELFRRAAEDYPLKTDSADWNAMVKKLSSGNPAPDNQSEKNKNYKHLLWLLLLLPLGWVYNNYVSNNNNNKSAGTSSKNIADRNLVQPSLPGKINSTSNTAQVVTVPSKNSSALINSTLNIPQAVTVPSKNYSALNNSSPFQRKTRGKLNSIITGNTSTLIIPGNPSSITTAAEVSDKKENVIIPGVSNDKNISTGSNQDKTETTVIKLNDDKKTGDATVKNKDKEITKSAQKKIRKPQERGLYAGIIISPDISTVKLQSVKNVGVNMGILAGYRLSKKISLESGVLWDKKYYYSDGKYFDTKRVYTNANTKIKNVDGVCNMIEVPLTVKYNLTSGKTNFSASAGFSSYFMKKEKYDYAISYNNGQPYQHSATYNNSSTNILAVANFSVGYNRELKQNITLRIEPYVKIPLKGVGMGSLPITSTGLNIGLTKKLSR
ncbi:MAG: hypothetical protein JWO92_1542 [Chitinophagaceae bacterium]|nr:hypothetical protein [Chitinophagaceae bacterium]